MITITLYKERRTPRLFEVKSTFTSELSTLSNKWKTFAKDNNIDEDLQIIQSDDLMLITCDEIHFMDIQCDEYPYDITPINKSFRKHCCVLSKKNEYHYPVDTFYINIINNDSYSPFVYAYDNILLTYASFLNGIINKCSLNGTEITINLSLKEWIFTLTPKYKNMPSLDYLQSIENVLTNTNSEDDNKLYELTFNIAKPSDNQVIMYIDNKKFILTPSNEPVNLEERDDILGNTENIAAIKTYINQVVQTNDFKERYNNLIKTTNFEQHVKQFVSNFPINNCTVTNVLIYVRSFVINIGINNGNSYLQWISQNDRYVNSILSSNKSLMNFIRNFTDIFSGNTLGFVIYYAANYIANNTCVNVLDYLLNFINGMPDTINPIKHVSCDVTPFVVDVPEQEDKPQIVFAKPEQKVTENTNKPEESSNIIWIILAIVAVVVIVVIILFVNKKKSSVQSVQINQQ